MKTANRIISADFGAGALKSYFTLASAAALVVINSGVIAWRKKYIAMKKALNSSSKTNRTPSARALKPFPLAIALCLCGLAAQGQNPRILPPRSAPYGKTYSQWQTAWWQWTFSLPVTASPGFDTADCSAGQSGPVWFLAGTAITSASVTRNCTIPAGKALFFPILTVENDNAGCADSDCPPASYSTDFLLASVNDYLDEATELSCTIDGKAVPGLSDPTTSAFRVESVFNYTVPADPNNFENWYLVNFCSAPLPGCYAGGGTVTGAVAAGVCVMVAPLSTGSHTIRFIGGAGGFVGDATYNLTVTSGSSD